MFIYFPIYIFEVKNDFKVDINQIRKEIFHVYKFTSILCYVYTYYIKRILVTLTGIM